MAKGIEIKDLKACHRCGKKHQAQFYVLDIDTAIVDFKTINQVAGLNQYFQGQSALAMMFAPSTRGAVLLSEETDAKKDRVILCIECLMDTGLAEILERMDDEKNPTD